MNKGYVIPFVLIVLLLVLAGFFTFTPVQSPTLPNDSVNPVTNNSIDEDEASETSEEIIDITDITTDISSTTSDNETEELATSTDSL